MIALTVLLVFLCGLFDFLRGSNRWIWPGRLTKILFTLLYGVCLGLLLNAEWYSLAIGVLWFAGSRGGWGYPIGHALFGVKPEIWDKGADGHASDGPEWYQKILGIGNRPWLSLLVRGVWWGLPAAILTAWVPLAPVLILASGVSFPASVWIGREVMPKDIRNNPHRTMERPFWSAAGMEWIRGWITGIFTATAGLILS